MIILAMKYLEWATLIIVGWMTLSGMFAPRRWHRMGRDFNVTVPVISLVVLIVAVLFLIFDVNKLHLIWVVSSQVE